MNLHSSSPILIRGYTSYILDLEKNKKLSLSVVDNSDFISLYILKIIDNSLYSDEQLLKDIETLHTEYPY